MSLIASPTAPLDPDGDAVAADGWFPAVPLASARAAVRIEWQVTTARLREAIAGAMLTALVNLRDWQAARVAEGAAALADVIDMQLAGENLAELLWQRAVRHLAAADLAATHLDISATATALDRAPEKAPIADEHRRQAWAALADLKSIGGTPIARNTVELI